MQDARTLTARVIPVPGDGAKRIARQAALVVGGSLLVAASARVRIPLPFTPVPITGQTFAVLLVGAALGPLDGALALALYLLEGFVGMPVFAGGAGGSAILLGPSAGYLFSYPIAAAVVGWLATRRWDRRVPTSVVAMLAGNLIIYVVGLPWLAITIGPLLAGKYHTSVLVATLLAGFVPFIIGDTLKLLLAAGLLPATWRVLGDRR